MKIVPSLPPLVTPPEDRLDVKPLTRVKPIKPVQERESPVVEQQQVEITAVHGEQRQDVEVDGERRTYCRRVEHLPFLIDMRSGPDRRRHNQREDDETEHIDEEV